MLTGRPGLRRLCRFTAARYYLILLAPLLATIAVISIAGMIRLAAHLSLEIPGSDDAVMAEQELLSRQLAMIRVASKWSRFIDEVLLIADAGPGIEGTFFSVQRLLAQHGVAIVDSDSTRLHDDQWELWFRVGGSVDEVLRALAGVVQAGLPLQLHALKLTADGDDRRSVAEMRLHSPHKASAWVIWEQNGTDADVRPPVSTDSRPAGYWAREGLTGKLLVKPGRGLVIVPDTVQGY